MLFFLRPKFNLNQIIYAYGIWFQPITQNLLWFCVHLFMFFASKRDTQRRESNNFTTIINLSVAAEATDG